MLKFHTFWLVICKLMRIRIELITLMWIRMRMQVTKMMRIHNTAFDYFVPFLNWLGGGGEAVTRDRESVLGPGEEEPLSWPPAATGAAEQGDATALAASGGGGQPDTAAADESRTAIAPRPTLARIHNGKIFFFNLFFFEQLKTVLRIRDPAFFTPGSGVGGIRSRMNILDNFSRSLETIFWVKILKFFDADADPDPGIFLTLHPGSRMEKIRIRDLG